MSSNNQAAGQDKAVLDQNNPYQGKFSEKNFSAFTVPNHNAKIIRESIENNTAPFLPDESGIIKTKPIYNGNTGWVLDAKDLIPLQIEQGDRSNIVVTFNTVNNAGTLIKKDEKGFPYIFKREDNTFGTSNYYFLEQTENPELVKSKVYGKIVQTEKKQLPESVIEIKSAEPEEYLGAYVAGCTNKATVKVSPEIAEQFKQNILPILKNQTVRNDKNKEIPSISDLMYKAATRAIQINKEIHADVQKSQQQAKSQEQMPQKKQHKEVERDFS